MVINDIPGFWKSSFLASRITFFSGFLTSAVFFFFQLVLWGPFLPPTSSCGFPAGLCLSSTSLLTLHTFPGKYHPSASTTIHELWFPSLTPSLDLTPEGDIHLPSHHSPVGRPQSLHLTQGHIPIMLPLHLLFLVACLGEWQPLLHFCSHQKEKIMLVLLNPQLHWVSHNILLFLIPEFLFHFIPFYPSLLNAAGIRIPIYPALLIIL